MLGLTIKNRYLPLAAFFLLGLVWGSNFIYMKLASELITPLQIVFFRVLFGFVPVCIYASIILLWKTLALSPHLRFRISLPLLHC